MRQLTTRWQIDRLGLAQRIVLVVALAFVVLTVGVYLMFLETTVRINSRLLVPSSQGPLLAYTLPRQQVLPPWEDLPVWIGLIGIWAGVGLWLLKPGTSPER